MPLVNPLSTEGSNVFTPVCSTTSGYGSNSPPPLVMHPALRNHREFLRKSRGLRIATSGFIMRYGNPQPEAPTHLGSHQMPLPPEWLPAEELEDIEPPTRAAHGNARSAPA